MPYPRLKPISNVTGIFEIISGDFGYGKIATQVGGSPDGGTTKIRSYDLTSGVVADVFDITTLDAGYSYERMWSTPIFEFLLVKEDLTARFFLYRAAAGTFTSWTFVYALGNNGSGGENATVEFLGQAGYSPYTKEAYFAEYKPNTEATGLAGTMRIAFGKVDATGTWTELAAWNEAETVKANLLPRHFHGCTVDQDNGLVYIATGDSAAQSWIIAWDPAVGIWEDDLTNVDFKTRPGFSVIDTENDTDDCRAININFSGDYVYWAADADNTARGIWRAERGLRSQKPTATKTNLLDLWPGSEGYYFGWNQLTLKDGRVLAFFCPQSESVPLEQSIIRVYCNDFQDSLNFRNIAMIHAAGGGGCRVEKVQYINDTNRISISFTKGSGTVVAGGNSTTNAGAASTTIVELWSIDGKELSFDEERPDTLWPVRFVAKTNALGVTSQDGVTGAGESSKASATWHGYDEFNTFLTLKHALTVNGAEIVDGVRIMVGDGVFEEDRIDFYSRFAQGYEISDQRPVVVSCSGRENTTIAHKNGNSDALLFKGAQIENSLEIEQATITSFNADNSVGTVLYEGSGGANHTFTYRDVTTGGDWINSAARPRQGVFTAIRSTLRANLNAGTNSTNATISMVGSVGVSCLVRLYSTVLGGGYTNIRASKANVSLEMVNVTLEGSTNRNKGIWNVTDPLDSLYMRNVVWLPESDSEQLFDMSVTPTAIDIDYIYDESPEAFLTSNASNVLSSNKKVSGSSTRYRPLTDSSIAQSGSSLPVIKAAFPDLNSSTFKMDADFLDINKDSIIGDVPIGALQPFYAGRSSLSSKSAPRAVVYIFSQTGAATSSVFTLQPSQEIQLFAVPALNANEYVTIEVNDAIQGWRTMGIVVNQFESNGFIINNKRIAQEYRLTKSATQAATRIESN